MNFLERFRHELINQEARPEILALAIAGMAYPELDIEEQVEKIDQLAAVVDRALYGIPLGYERAARFIDVLHYDLGFTGNREQYYEPDNSYLNVVLRRRMGLPIMLSLLCMAIGRRLALDISGLGFPGHFMVRYQDPAGAWLLDPFHSQVMALDAANHYLSNLFERPVTLSSEMFEPISAVLLTQRILNNLRNAYLGRKDFLMTLQVLDYLLLLNPAEPGVWQEKGLLHYQVDDWEAASYHLRRYFFLSGQYLLAQGHEKNTHLAAATLQPQDRQILEIFQQIEEMRRRIN
ncbi:MAG: transglutaminase family protein [Caldilineaceae bacterium]|nr:transglutaminase family protein [Caldilineaceae bacterium]